MKLDTTNISKHNYPESQKPKVNGLIRHQMTERQIEVFDCLVICELTSDEVAKKLFISQRTVQFHINNVIKLFDTPSCQVACIRYCKELYIDGIIKL